MRSGRLLLILVVLGAMIYQPVSAYGRGGGKGKGGGGKRVSHSGGAKRSAPKQRKSSGSGAYRPSSGSHRSKPAQRPTSSGGSSRLPHTAKPSQRPQQRPNQRPQGSGAGIPSNAGGNRARSSGTIPTQRNAQRPAQKPAQRPSQLPARKPVQGGGDLRGTRPNAGNRPGNGSAIDRRPGNAQRPARPARSEKWNNVQNRSNNNWNNWKKENNVRVNNFQVNRTTNWNSVNKRYTQNGWARNYGTKDYNNWRRDVNNYRRGRGAEVWSRRTSAWDNAFDRHWWSTCSWRRRPYVSVGVSPWWWWRPFAWAGAGVFFGSAIASDPIIYDPGTTVIYEGDTYYVDGEVAGTATEARQSAIELATPVVEEIPVPDPVAEGEPEQWMPLGVWALTQQEQGDATMFMQFSVDKNGLLAGAYKNVLTGDEQPIIGQVDLETQRVAWHVGEATQTVYEAGLSGMENDVISVFVHFGEDQTQTWLLVRLPSPEIPPGTVKLPEI